LLTASPAYGQLDEEKRRSLARDMVRVCHAAATLIGEELEASDGAVALAAPAPAPAAAAAPTASSAPAAPRTGITVARSLGGAAPFGEAASRVAGTTRAVLNAVSFPRFVTDLINGVFRAMIDSSTQQMESYVQLLNAVAATTDGFGDSNVGPARARAWLIEHYPDSFEWESEPEEIDPDASPEERADATEERQAMRVRMRGSGKFPAEAGLRADLGLAENESVPTAGDPETALVPLVRRRLAKMRQEMLATMVMLGMQRIVVDSGRISASMRFHIDTRSALAHDEASRFGLENEITASGSFGIGAWGASASVRNNISYVSTEKTMSTEELNTELDLNSSVEINFKSDYLPLNRLASPGQTEAIRANSRNPEAEIQAAAKATETRQAGQRAEDSARRQSLDSLLQPNARQSQPPKAEPQRTQPTTTQPTTTQPRQPETGRSPAPRTGGSTTPPPQGGQGAAPPAQASPPGSSAPNPEPAQGGAGH